MSTEQTSEKPTTEVFYEDSEAKEQTVIEGDKETKPTQETETAQPTGDKEPNKESESESESEAEGEKEKESEGDKDKPSEENALKDFKDLKIPKDVKMSEDAVKEVYEQAKELGLNKTQAQALLDAKSVSENIVLDRAMAQIESLKATWLEDFKKDPDIGGDRAIETAEHAKRAIDAFAGDKLKKTLDDSGFGNHPEMLRMLSKVGQKLLANDSFISGKSVTSKSKSTADVFYGESNNQF